MKVEGESVSRAHLVEASHLLEAAEGEVAELRGKVSLRKRLN